MVKAAAIRSRPRQRSLEPTVERPKHDDQQQRQEERQQEVGHHLKEQAGNHQQNSDQHHQRDDSSHGRSSRMQVRLHLASRASRTIPERSREARRGSGDDPPSQSFARPRDQGQRADPNSRRLFCPRSALFTSGPIRGRFFPHPAGGAKWARNPSPVSQAFAPASSFK